MEQGEIKPLAIFDVDGTQFKSACVEKVSEAAIERGIFQPDAFAQAHAKRRLWQANNNEGVYQSYLHHLVGGFISSMIDVDVEEFTEVTQNMVAEHRVRKFKYTSALAALLKPSHTLIAISGSPLVVVEPFLEGVGFDQIIGSTFEVQNGKYTGKAHSVDKAAVIHDLTTGLESSSISVGIGDTVGDLPVLSASDCPIAFNPSQTLRSRAIEESWYIVTEHKDAVTQFLPKAGSYEPVFDSSPAIILDHASVAI